jgi:hypothetical protein
MDKQSSAVYEVMIELAKMVATIKAQQDMLDAMKKREPEPITYVDLERQEHEAYEREGR